MRTAPVQAPVILVTGARGQVGFELQRSLALVGSVVAVDRSSCDLVRPEQLRECVRRIRPQIIVNAAAYTAVDKAEADRAQAYAINASAPEVLAEEASALGAPFVHFSTDYVFDGASEVPYHEEDATAPLSVYGASKLEGELAIRRVGDAGRAPWWILRTSWVYGLHGLNFLKTMLRLAAQRESLSVVADQVGAPTGAALIADVTAQLLRRRPASGVYHLAPAGATSWHGYAARVIARAQMAGLRVLVSAESITPITTAAYPTAARRPANSRLDSSKLQEALGCSFPDWTLGVDQVVDLIMENRLS